MAIFTAVVMETVTHERLYTIDADTQAEAEAKAAIGDTIGEIDLKNHGVVSREVESVEMKADQTEDAS